MWAPREREQVVGRNKDMREVRVRSASATLYRILPAIETLAAEAVRVGMLKAEADLAETTFCLATPAPQL